MGLPCLKPPIIGHEKTSKVYIITIECLGLEEVFGPNCYLYRHILEYYHFL